MYCLPTNATQARTLRLRSNNIISKSLEKVDWESIMIGKYRQVTVNPCLRNTRRNRSCRCQHYRVVKRFVEDLICGIIENYMTCTIVDTKGTRALAGKEY